MIQTNNFGLVLFFFQTEKNLNKIKNLRMEYPLTKIPQRMQNINTH